MKINMYLWAQPFIENMVNPAVSLITVPKADHNFYGMLDEFEELPKYLLDERG